MGEPFKARVGWTKQWDTAGVICDSMEKAEQVLRDHQAMEALRSAERSDQPAMVCRAITGWGACMSHEDSGPYYADDPADAILAATAPTETPP